MFTEVVPTVEGYVVVVNLVQRRVHRSGPTVEGYVVVVDLVQRRVHRSGTDSRRGCCCCSSSSTSGSQKWYRQ